MLGAGGKLGQWTAILLAASLLAPPSGLAQEPASDPTTLDDVVVAGRRLEEAIRQYVESLSAPARARGLARWDSALCVDVINLQPVIKSEIVGRIREVATALGIPVEPDGCDPNVVVMGADNGPALADAIVDRFRYQFFRFGFTRSNAGAAALEGFRGSDAPVRWWHVSLPVHAITGAPMIRLPGRPPVDLPCYSRSTAIKDIAVVGLGGSRTGRSCSAITDQIVGLWIIVDVNAASGLSSAQLADYLAFVTMAQVDPEANMATFDTVLNLFEYPEDVTGITAWDETYLLSLYAGENERLEVEEQAARMLGSLSAENE